MTGRDPVMDRLVERLCAEVAKLPKPSPALGANDTSA